VNCVVPEDLKRLVANPERRGSDSDFLFLRFDYRDGHPALELTCTEDAYCTDTLFLLAKHCETLLQSAFETPDQPVSRLPMMSEEELRHVLVEQNGVIVPFARTTISEAFEAQVQNTPHSAALFYGGQTVTYRELQMRAMRLAASLQAVDVGPETLVGVYLDDPVAIAVAYVGIINAGGVLVALDYEWPRERLEQVVREARPRFVVTSVDLRSEIPSDIRHILVQPDLEGPQHLFHKPKITPDGAAYVVFTSGSTGTPKGVVGLQRTITSLPRIAHPLKEKEVIALSASLAFGAGVVGLFFALIQGASVLLVPRSVAKDLPALVDAWETAGVTRIVAVAPQLRQLSLLGPETVERLSNITSVLLSGAVLTPDMLPAIYSLFPRALIINAYSCLEVGSITRWVSVPDDRNRPLTVGSVLPNTRVYILGPKLSPLPAGMPGEIYVGSADMSREYLNRPELTRERFLESPFGVPDIPRLYRTGDVGRFLPNGELEYLGRADNQVKVRGIRIELEEIEAALQKKVEVQQAVVVAEPHGTESRLIAFVSAKPGHSLVTSAIRKHLRACLPPYMVPSLFVLTDQLPMTRNGKIDRQRLPRMGTNRPEIDTPYVTPSSEIEMAITAIWEDVLGIEGIGVEDHFLEIGGDSLLAVLICMRIQEGFGWVVSGTSIFEFPTVRALVTELSQEA
jgi:amino acid adenylation domain-containing protein